MEDALRYGEYLGICDVCTFYSLSILLIISSLEPWETALIMSIVIAVASIILFSVLFYAPAQLLRLKSRLAYYLFGSESSQKETIAVLNEWHNVIRGVSNS